MVVGLQNTQQNLHIYKKFTTLWTQNYSLYIYIYICLYLYTYIRTHTYIYCVYLATGVRICARPPNNICKVQGRRIVERDHFYWSWVTSQTCVLYTNRKVTKININSLTWTERKKKKKGSTIDCINLTADCTTGSLSIFIHSCSCRKSQSSVHKYNCQFGCLLVFVFFIFFL